MPTLIRKNIFSFFGIFKVSLIPTYESDILRQWFATNADGLAKLNIDVLPSANYNTLTIDGNPDIAYQVYKLEF